MFKTITHNPLWKLLWHRNSYLNRVGVCWGSPAPLISTQKQVGDWLLNSNYKTKMAVHPQKGWSGDRLFPRLDLLGKALGRTWKLYDIEERLENLRAEPPFQPFSLGLDAPLPGWRQPCQTTKETPLLKCQLDLHHKCMWEFNFHLTFQPLVNHLGSHYFFNIQSVFHEKILDLIINEWNYMYNKDQLPIW